VTAPDYAELLTRREPLRRSDVYGSGPPVAAVSGEILGFKPWMQGAVLDFGCGAGALVHELRRNGTEAWGLELDTPVIRDALLEDVAPYVTLYDGTFPTPLESKHFDTVTSVEVLEHIEDFSATIAELARLTRDRLLLTTPDLSAIPLLHRHRVVPWHLLEPTHVSLFTQESLARLLRTHFETVEFFRIGPTSVNGTLFHTSLLATCRGPSSAVG
jgi:2-polyprenyl-3-methyl-5-hydroxy-6-metoxy-1,4-benzoquinol methylase